MMPSQSQRWEFSRAKRRPEMNRPSSRKRIVNDARALTVALLVTTALLCGCAVQLVPPYNANIDKNASDLQKDYYVFIGNMQIQAGTPDGYYSNHVKDYTDFEARLAVIRFQAENDPGGMPCGQAIKLIQKTNGSALDRVDPQIKQRLQSVGESDSCITILARLAEQEMESLRQLHEKGCNKEKPTQFCRSIFSNPPLFNVITGPTSDAPAVSAVSIALNKLVRQEQMMKPAPKA